MIGKRFGVIRLPWSKQKSLAGSGAVFTGGLIFAVGIIALYLAAGVLNGTLIDYLPALAIIAFAGTVIESFPFRDIDNITVPLAAVVFGHLLLPG